MEQIYTIPVNEVFEEARDSKSYDCPFCKLFNKLEKKEVELALGPSMMEPSTRIQTNEKGFCKDHFSQMLEQNNKLSLALILESHIDTIRGKMKGNFLSNLTGAQTKKSVKVATGLGKSCYICERIEYNFSRMLETAVLLYAYDVEFKQKLKGQKCFCLPHYERFMTLATQKLDKKKQAELSRDVAEIQNAYLEKLKNDVSWFCKKFDYRYDAEPWYDSKDAVERTIRFLSSGTDKERK